MKKFLLLALFLILICTSYAFAENAESIEYECSDFRYTLCGDGTAEITRYVGEAQELEVPAELDGNCVISVGQEAFAHCYSLTTIWIPEGVTEIGDRAFYGCESLVNIFMHSGVTRIGNEAFYGCGSIFSILIPDSVTEIGSGAFSMCYNLVGITIPDSVTKIGDDIFNNCNAVMEVGHDSYAEQYAIDNGIRYIYPEFWME